MRKTPISLIIDDSAPRVFVYYEHAVSRFTKDGRPLLDNIPNGFLDRFCDIVERYGIRGKFSVVPMPGGKGRIDGDIEGYDRSEIRVWLDTANRRLAGRFAFCPEMLTHAGWIDLATEQMMNEQENDWSFRQDQTTLTPYIARALEIQKNAGIRATGVTSPWDFGVKVEDDYAKAVALAFEQVWGVTESWYFCRSPGGVPNARPWIAYDDGKRRVVSIGGTIGDCIWPSMDTTDTSEEYVSRVADIYITEDGLRGAIPEVLAINTWPVLVVHWQSLFSNGAETGLRILARIADRVERRLGDTLEWTSFDTLMRRTLDGDL